METSQLNENILSPQNDQKVLDEPETLDYLACFLNISKKENGSFVDEKLEEKCKNLHKLFSGHHLTLVICAHFLRENVQKFGADLSSTISKMETKFMERHNQPGTMLAHWSKYKRKDNGQDRMEPALSTLLVEIVFEDIRQKFQYEGQLSLKLLGYLAIICQNVQIIIDLQTCFLIFHGRELEHVTVTDGVDPKKETRMDNDNVEDFKKLKFLLTILKKYFLIIHDMAADDDENFELTSSIKMDPMVQQCLRQHQQVTQDWSYVFDLVNLFSETDYLFSQKYLSHLMTVHGTLKEFFWPETGYRYSLHFAAAMILNNGSTQNGTETEATKILRDVYQFFVTKFQTHNDEEEEKDFENFNLCKILIISLSYGGYGGGEEEAGYKFLPEMDNSHLFQETDPLCRVTRTEFLDWVIDQTVQFYRNELIQHFTINILLQLSTECVSEIMDRERIQKIEIWINKFNKKILRGNLDRLFVVRLTQSPLTVLKIGSQCEIFQRVPLLRLAIDMMRASVDCEGDAKCCWFLQEVFYLMKPSPICVWEEHDSDDLDDIQDVCEIFVEHGMTTFVQMLEELEKNYREDGQELNYNFFSFLETIQSTTFFDDCVTALLESTEFFEGLRKLFDVIVEGIEAQKDHENIRAICHILVFWCSLVSNPDNQHHGTAVSIIDELKNFSERFSEEQSPIAHAFDSEIHWHKGFREQGRRTSDKILDKFLASRHESPTDYVYNLAKRLKNTINQKKGWLLLIVSS